MELVISNLASLDGVIAGLVNPFNIVEAAAWKTYTDTAAGAVKDWSHSMADYTETFANARIAAAVAFSHTEATEAKAAGDLIAAANTVWTNSMADADKVYSDAMAVAAHTETDLLAAANKAKDIADSTARLNYTNTVAPLAVTLAEALSGFGVTRVTAIATAGETLSKATADAGVTFVGALASPGIDYATAMAEADKTYAITMAGISKDESVASATLEKARLASLDASDSTFDYYGGGSSYYGGGGYGYGYVASQFLQGYYLQGHANILNGLQDSAIGLVNLTQMPGNYLWGDLGLGNLNSPDWSNGRFTQESETAHGISKFAGAFGVETLTGAWAGRVVTAVDEAGRCLGWFSRLWNGGCFVPGTLVTLSDLPQGHELQAVLWANDSFLDDITDSRGGIALLESPAKTATTFKIAIEDVPLGARVPTKNPRPWEYDDSLTEPVQETWAKISITVEREDGGIVDAELIRPRSWIESNGIRAGHLLPLNIAELQVAGFANVTAVDPCPMISGGEGSVITGRFATRQVDIIARAEILGADGTIETLEGTTVHPVWSLDREAWVELGELTEGEQLSGQAGTAVVISHLVHRCSTAVHNIEVHGEHVYEVGRLEILVHNTIFCGVLSALDSLPGRIGKTGPIKEVPDAKALHELFDSLSNGAKTINPGTYPGIVKELADGTIVRLRAASKSGGATIDITMPNGTIVKVHIE